MCKPNTLQKFFLFSLLFAIISRLITGCGIAPKDHPEQMEAILKFVESWPEASVRRMQSLDSGFYRIKEPSIADKSRFYNVKVQFYGRSKDYIKANKYVDSIIILTEERIDEPKYAKFYTNALVSKGDINLSLKRYDESLAYFTKAREIMSKKAPNDCGFPSYMYFLGNIHYAQEKYRSAAFYYKSAVQVDSCFNNEFIRFLNHQLYLDNIGMCYSKLSMWDSAMYFYNSTLKYISENESRFPVKQDYMKTAKAVVQGNQAGVYAAYNNFTTAEPLYLQSIALINTYDNDFAQTLRLELVSLYLSNRLYQKAKNILTAVDSSLRILPSENILLKYYHSMADYHNALSDKTSASNFMRRYSVLKDSLQLRDQKFASLDARSNMEALYQKAINENLEKDNQLKSIYLFIAISFSIIGGLVFAWIWFAYKQTARLNNELALKSERERISKELHDDLGSGLTSLQIMVRRVMNQQPGNTQNETLHSIASVSEELIDQMSEVVWVLNNANDTVNGLLAHLRIYMADYIEKTRLDLSLEFNYTCKVNYPINNVLRRNLLLIVKEVFHNVIKHADASRFLLAASCEEKRLRIIMQDDGGGLQDNILSNGNGLKNIKSRIKSMHGTVSFNSSNGLQVIIDVPI